MAAKSALRSPSANVSCVGVGGASSTGASVGALVRCMMDRYASTSPAITVNALPTSPLAMCCSAMARFLSRSSSGSCPTAGGVGLVAWSRADSSSAGNASRCGSLPKRASARASSTCCISGLTALSSSACCPSCACTLRIASNCASAGGCFPASSPCNLRARNLLGSSFRTSIVDPSGKVICSCGS